MLGKTRLLPVLIVAFVMALTPVLASADAIPKDDRAKMDTTILALIDEAPDGLSGGELVSWVAKALKNSDSDLAKAVAGDSSLEGLNHGRIVSAIARADKTDEAATENEDDDSANSTEEERGKSAANKQHGKDQNQINSQVDETDDEGEATTEDEDSGDKGQSEGQGQGQGNAHAQGPKK